MNSEEIKYAGVFCAQKKDGTPYYRSSFTFHNKHISLGSFSSPLAAHKAYLEAVNITSDNHISIFNYSTSHFLSFEKWVVLINFRDNNLYFPTPIYIRKKYFSYYLSLHQELKFSIDDLFYYSSHKIMQRGGHLFVSDYGMQITILGRYGIKNYGILGKDYVLINNDPLDFRYENIHIVNTYNGVRLIKHKKKPSFQARIHLNGDFIIGYYEDSIHAAIAYNKAIDVVLKNGIKKQFKQNYTEGISPSVYAEIYSEIKIPEKIRNYRAE